MRILYLSQYFPPEVGATQTRAYEMARGLVRAGHQVTMLTELPNHPAGIVHEEYRGRLLVRRELDGIDVIHTWVKASPQKTLRTRLVFYLSYMMSAIIAGLVAARGRYDVIYATSPPLFVGGAALLLSLLRRTPLVFEVRDLWPESAVALGELRNPRFIRWAFALAGACYRRARRIVAVTAGTRQGIVDTGISAEKIAIIPNGANTDRFFHDEAGRKRIRAALGLEDKFVLVYAGILGLAYNLDTILDAADRLRARPDLVFLIIGAGPREQALRQRLASLDLPAVRLLGEVAYAELPAYLSAAEAALIPLRRLSLFDGTLPVKMFDAWACETPTILAVEGGESAVATEAAGGGIVVAPEDAVALADSIAALAANPEALAEMGRKGRVFVVANYSRQRQAEMLADLLEEVAGK